MSIPFVEHEKSELGRRRVDTSGIPTETLPGYPPAESVEHLNRAWIRSRAVPLALLFGLFVGVYASTFRFMAQRWAHDSAYQHGWLVIPVALGVVWYRRERLARIPAGSHVAGLGLIVLAMLLHLSEKVLDLNGPSPLSIPIFVAGAVWYFLGTGFLCALAFPIAYLLFMIPIPGGFTEVVSFPLRLLATNGSKIAAGWFGVKVEGSGMNIAFGQPYGYEQIMLTVADPCSGLHSLMAIKALHAITAYLTRLKLGWKWVLFMCAIPIALTANLTRITGIILIGAYWRKDIAVGLFHDWSSPVLFAIAFAILISIGRFLEWATLSNPSRDRFVARVTGRKPTRLREQENEKIGFDNLPVKQVQNPSMSGRVAQQNRAGIWLNFGTVLTFMGLTLAGSIAFANKPDVNLPVADMRQIPKRVGEWTLQHDQDLTDIMSQLKADSYSDRIYVNSRTRQSVELLVVYRRYGRREFAHRPELCFPAAGYSIQKNGTIPLTWAGRQARAVSITANGQDGQKNLAYFFASGKRTEENFLRQQVWMAFERIIPNKNGWTFIRLQSPTVTTPQDSVAAEQDFMRAMAPALERVITTDGTPTNVASVIPSDTKKAAGL